MSKKYTSLAAFVIAFLLITAFQVTTTSKENGEVLVPGGQFRMGIPRSMITDLVELGRKVPHMDEELAYSWFADETPENEITVNSFYIDRHEVTNEKYQEFVKQTGYESEGNWEKWSGEGRRDHPVVGVTWNDAKACCEWQGMSLPTEAQWEYAAKGGTDNKLFPWGDEPDPDRANYREQGEDIFEGLIRLMGLREIDTSPVGSYPPNGYGLYDMLGNASEWCINQQYPYPGAPPEPSLYDEGRVVRGGCWDDPNPVFVRITRRTAFPADSHSYTRGFRCVKPVDEDSTAE